MHINERFMICLFICENDIWNDESRVGATICSNVSILTGSLSRIFKIELF